MDAQNSQCWFAQGHDQNVVCDCSRCDWRWEAELHPIKREARISVSLWAEVVQD